MSRTLHLFGTDWCAMMVPIQVIRWYRMQCYDGTDSCATVVPIRRYCQDTKVKETLIPFAKELKLLYQQVSDNEHRVSLPIPVAYCLLSVFLCSITYWGIVIFANYQLIHSAELWKCTWLMIGMSVFLVILLGYCGYRKWL